MSRPPRSAQRASGSRIAALTNAVALASILVAIGVAAAAAATPPVPSRRENVVDRLHGVEVFDPYRWLENSDSPEVATWTDKQNSYTRSVLDAVPGRAAIEKRLWQLYEVGQVSTPVVRK